MSLGNTDTLYYDPWCQDTLADRGEEAIFSEINKTQNPYLGVEF